MLAPVRCECGVCAEWTMIELQGEIDVQGAFKDEMQNLRIGILCQTPTVSPPSTKFILQSLRAIPESAKLSAD